MRKGINKESKNEKLSVRNNRTRSRTNSTINVEDTKNLAKNDSVTKNNVKRKISKKKTDVENCNVFEEAKVAFENNEQQNSEKSDICISKNKQCKDNYCKNITYKLKTIENGQQYSNLQVWRNKFVDQFLHFNPISIMNPFQRRVTAVSWNKTHPNFVALGSKGGELTLINIDSLRSTETYIEGVGPGGCINSVKFDAEKPSIVYTACLTGEILRQDFDLKNNAVLMTLEAHGFNNWFCSLDVLYEKKMLACGDCKGQIYFIPITGEKVTHSLKLHQNKISHIEICPKNTNLFVTSSVDRKVKVWDLRKLSSGGSAEALATLYHNHPVNSAYFSEANCFSLLTTDQREEIRIYSCNTWDPKATIFHPHPQFQHITPIRASWYPLEDIVVVGRFPDERYMKNDDRTIDFYDGHTKELLHRLSSHYVKGISPLNYFNSTGDVLVSASGRNIIFWKNLPDS